MNDDYLKRAAGSAYERMNGMRCPFLREAQVKFCYASACRKMILRLADEIPGGKERCSSAEYVACPIVKEFREDVPHRTHCPFLQETLVQYCSASPVTKFIPYSTSTFPRCGNDNHQYCELYLSKIVPAAVCAGADREKEWIEREVPPGADTTTDGIRVPGYLWYAANHLWLDVSAERHLHVGVDAFMSRVLGPVDRINYVTQKGTTRPAVVLTVGGVDLHIVFPITMKITATNSSLRTHPGRLTSDPYTLGWLFEGAEPDSSADSGGDPTPGLLIPGAKALPWVQGEVRRLVTLLQDLSSRVSIERDEELTMADGGTFTAGVVRLLEREEVLAVYNEFFSAAPLPGVRK
jgi:glycine cleavage system H lipoate-binding protein